MDPPHLTIAGSGQILVAGSSWAAAAQVWRVGTDDDLELLLAGGSRALLLPPPAACLRRRVEKATGPAGASATGDACGARDHGDGRAQVHQVAVPAFAVDITTVTVADVARLIEDTGHRTEAEVSDSSTVSHLALGARGAHWCHPDGPSSAVHNARATPVVHVSRNDARARSARAGRRLPTEAECRQASRGGLAGARHPWGDGPLDPQDGWSCTTSRGRSPVSGTRQDGWLTTAPVRSFALNWCGQWQTVADVQEWCADWSSALTHAADSAAGQVSRPPVEHGGLLLGLHGLPHRRRTGAPGRLQRPPSCLDGKGEVMTARPTKEQRCR